MVNVSDLEGTVAMPRSLQFQLPVKGFLFICGSLPLAFARLSGPTSLPASVV
jgi:hypothetical protein